MEWKNKYQLVRDCFCNRIGVQYNDWWGYVDPNGLEVIPCQFLSITNFFKDRAWVLSNNQRWGIIDPSGNWLIKPFIEDIDFNTKFVGFSHDFTWVQINQRWGVVDLNGNWVVQPQFLDNGSPFADGLSLVKVDQYYGFIDTTGVFVIPPQFDFAKPFVFGVAWVHKPNSAWGLIDTSGKEISKFKYWINEDLLPLYEYKAFMVYDPTLHQEVFIRADGLVFASLEALKKFEHQFSQISRDTVKQKQFFE